MSDKDPMEDKVLAADLHQGEFDPTSELHHPVLLVKFVDPGCTLELQIEEASTGNVTRLTTTEDPEFDRQTFIEALVNAFTREMDARGI